MKPVYRRTLIPRPSSSMHCLSLALLIFVPSTIAAQPEQSIANTVAEGMSCKQQRNSSQMDCSYKVGTGLHFEIAGIGQPDAGVTFYKVDWDSDFYATFGLQHGCVVVKQGKRRLDRLPPRDARGMSMAFVSPKNGKVYAAWQDCAAAR